MNTNLLIGAIVGAALYYVSRPKQQVSTIDTNNVVPVITPTVTLPSPSDVNNPNTVTDPIIASPTTYIPSSGDWPNEPNGFHTLVDTDFSTPTGNGQLIDEYNSSQVTSMSDAPYSPPMVMQATLLAGRGFGGNTLWIPNFQVANEIYVGMWFKRDYDSYGSGINKFAFTKTAGVNGYWMGYYDGWQVAYDLQAVQVNNCHLPSPLGLVRGDSYCSILWSNGYIPKNVWTRIEWYMKGSSTPTSQDGIVRLWLTPKGGTLTQHMNYTNVNLPGPFISQVITQTWASSNGITPLNMGNDSVWNQYIDHYYVSVR